jgi:hypothetical protein
MSAVFLLEFRVFLHDVVVFSAGLFLALTASVFHGERVKLGIFFALVRELLSLAQRK